MMALQRIAYESLSVKPLRHSCICKLLQSTMLLNGNDDRKMLTAASLLILGPADMVTLAPTRHHAINAPH